MYINSPSPVLFWSFYENSKSVALNSKLHTHSQFGKRNRLNLALSVYFTKVSNQRNGIITNPNLVLLRIPFFRILHRGVLGVLLDLLASAEAAIDEGVDEEAEEDEDGGAQDGVEGEGHPHLARNYTTIILLMIDFQNLGLVQLALARRAKAKPGRLQGLQRRHHDRHQGHRERHQICYSCQDASTSFFTGESDSKAMASLTFSFMEFTFSTVASFNKVTFSVADSFPSITFSIAEPQM